MVSPSIATAKLNTIVSRLGGGTACDRDQAEARSRPEQPLDRLPERQQRLVRPQRAAPEPAGAAAALPPPARHTEQVERAQLHELQARVRDQALQPLAGVAALVAVLAVERAVQARVRRHEH